MNSKNPILKHWLIFKIATRLNEEAFLNLISLIELTIYQFRRKSQKNLQLKYIGFYYKSVLNVLLQKIQTIATNKIRCFEKNKIITELFAIFSLIFEADFDEKIYLKKKKEFLLNGKKELLKSFEKFSFSFEKAQL